MDKSFPARLHIVLASASSKSVIFRRGPSKAVCTFLWDRKTDSIETGQARGSYCPRSLFQTDFSNL